MESGISVRLWQPNRCWILNIVLLKLLYTVLPFRSICVLLPFPNHKYIIKETQISQYVEQNRFKGYINKAKLADIASNLKLVLYHS